MVDVPCSNCISSNVCKYKQELLKNKQELLKIKETIKTEAPRFNEDIFAINVRCKYFITSTILRNGR